MLNNSAKFYASRALVSDEHADAVSYLLEYRSFQRAETARSLVENMRGHDSDFDAWIQKFSDAVEGLNRSADKQRIDEQLVEGEVTIGEFFKRSDEISDEFFAPVDEWFPGVLRESYQKI